MLRANCGGEKSNQRCPCPVVACSDHSLVYVAVDQTDLTFKDPHRIRGLGPDNAKMSKVLRTTRS